MFLLYLYVLFLITVKSRLLFAIMLRFNIMDASISWPSPRWPDYGGPKNGQRDPRQRAGPLDPLTFCQEILLGSVLYCRPLGGSGTTVRSLIFGI